MTQPLPAGRHAASTSILAIFAGCRDAHKRPYQGRRRQVPPSLRLALRALVGVSKDGGAS